MDGGGTGRVRRNMKRRGRYGAQGFCSRCRDSLQRIVTSPERLEHHIENVGDGERCDVVSVDAKENGAYCVHYGRRG